MNTKTLLQCFTNGNLIAEVKQKKRGDIVEYHCHLYGKNTGWEIGRFVYFDIEQACQQAYSWHSGGMDAIAQPGQKLYGKGLR